jgi:AraC family transcriptional regulator
MNISNYMNLVPDRIEILSPKKLIGMHMTMSLSDNKTQELWRSFMPRRKEIPHRLTTDLFSLQVYDSSYFEDFRPNQPFEKWALVEVGSTEAIPDGMEVFDLIGGEYAVFIYKNIPTRPQHVFEFFQYIYAVWLPSTDYCLDDKPHFEILSDTYKQNSADAEEEVWIPIKTKPLG